MSGPVIILISIMWGFLSASLAVLWFGDPNSPIPIFCLIILSAILLWVLYETSKDPPDDDEGPKILKFRK
jgi:4-hydroxybenzoate polyprenyltransferase